MAGKYKMLLLSFKQSVFIYMSAGPLRIGDITRFCQGCVDSATSRVFTMFFFTVSGSLLRNIQSHTYMSPRNRNHGPLIERQSFCH